MFFVPETRVNVKKNTKTKLNKEKRFMEQCAMKKTETLWFPHFFFWYPNLSIKDVDYSFRRQANNLRQTEKKNNLGNSIRGFFSLLERSLHLKFGVWKFTYCVYFFILISCILAYFWILQHSGCSWNRNNQIVWLFFCIYEATEDFIHPAT